VGRRRRRAEPFVDGGPAQRAVSLALALVLAASVALIWT
jgi:hypothetical protein